MPERQAITVEFPLRGIDLSTEASAQLPQTTPHAVNVQSADALEQRIRGGSRPGLVRYVDARVNGNNPIQNLGVVVTQAVNYHLMTYDQTYAPGIRVSDTSTSNFPDGPNGTGPGGDGHGGPSWPGGGNRRVPTTGRTILSGGSGIMPVREIGSPPPPPPPSPPGFVTRTYYPYAVNHATELFGVISVGPVALPLVPPTDLSLIAVAVDYFGDSFNPDGNWTAWGGVGLPTVAELNAMMTSWLSSPPPYETSVDT